MAASAVANRIAGNGEDRSTQRSALLNLSGIDAADEQDEILEKCRTYVTSLLVGVSPPEVANKLSSACCEMAAHNDIMLGLMTKILVEPGSARMGFHNLSLLNRDGWASIVRNLELVIMEKFSKLQEKPRAQLLWLVNEMVQTGGKGVMGCEKLVLALVRNIEGGNLDNSNIWLAEQVLNLLQDNRAWVEQKQAILCTALYTYLRLIPDHSSAALTSLRVAEIDFCMSLLRNRFSDCMTLGRDLLRMLQAVARIPEFAQFWIDILQKPESLSPHFTGIRQLLDIRTSRRYIASRLTHDMETKISFLLSKVSMGQQKRYQDWFHSQFLSSPDRQSLIPDLVRYICCVVHPTNEVLASNIVPRWAVIGWLLLSCQSNVTASNAKLALFYDWFFYNPTHPEENIMNIEPGLLVMNQSLLKHPNMTATLLDFLCRMSTEFCPPLKDMLVNGVSQAFQDCNDKGVIQSLPAMLANGHLDGELKLLINRTFPQFTSQALEIATSSTDSSSTAAAGQEKSENIRPGPRHANNMHAEPGDGFQPTSSATAGAANTGSALGSLDAGTTGNAAARSASLMYNFSAPSATPPPAGAGIHDNSHHDDSVDDVDDGDVGDEACFSGDEDGDNGGGGVATGAKGLLSDVVAKTPVKMLDSLVSDVRSALEALDQAQEVNDRCQHLQTVLNAYINQATPSALTVEHTASSLAFCLQSDFANACCEIDPDAEDELPPVLYRHCVALSSTPAAVTVLTLLSNVQQYFPSTGYRLLYHLHMSNGSFEVYRQYSLCFRDLDLLSCLERDLKVCQEEDPVTFYALVPCVFTVFAEVAVGSSILIYLLVSFIDSVQLHEMVCDLMVGKYQIFGYSGLVDIIQASMEWEMFEQYFVWQLLSAEGCSVRELLPLLLELDAAANAEPATGLLFILRQKTPDYVTTAALLRCSDDPHHIAPCVLHHWAKLHPFALTSLLVDLTRGAKVNDEMMTVDSDDVTRHLIPLRKLLPENNALFEHPTLRQLLDNAHDDNASSLAAGILSSADSINPGGMKRRNSEEWLPGEKRIRGNSS